MTEALASACTVSRRLKRRANAKQLLYRAEHEDVDNDADYCVGYGNYS